MADILQTFAKDFVYKVLNFDTNFTEVCSWESDWLIVIIGSGNDLASNRQPTLTWTNNDQGFWHHMALLGHNELKIFFLYDWWCVL